MVFVLKFLLDGYGDVRDELKLFEVILHIVVVLVYTQLFNYMFLMLHNCFLLYY